VTPFFVLFPWSLHLFASPSDFLAEAGVSTPGLTTRGLPPTALLALSPGGPGVPPVWVTIGLGLALLALLLPVRRAGLLITGWVVAIAGILAAVLVSRATVTPSAGGQSASGWPGVATAVAALGLLLASAPAAEWLASIIPNGSGQLSPAGSSPSANQPSGYGRWRRLLACVALAAAASAPLLVGVYWVKDGVRGPVGRISAPLLPAFVSASSTSGQQYRTLILRPDGAGLDYLVVRQEDPTLGEPELGVASAAGAALSRQVAALGAPDVADAGDPGLVLGSFGIRWVLLPSPVDPVLAQRLDQALGLIALNKGPSYDLWQVTGPVARVRVVAADGTTTELSSGTVNMSGVTAPPSGGSLILDEPYGGWTATLNGQALKPVATPVDGWAQGFVLPQGGGQLSISRNDLARMLSLVAELLATMAICLLALPGKRADPVQEAKALTALREARNGKRAASPARGGPRGVPAAGAGHRAASAVDRLGFARKRRAGQAQPDPVLADPAVANPVVANPVVANRAPADLGSSDLGLPGDVPADWEPAVEAARDAELAEAAAPGAAAAVGLADRRQERYSDLRGDNGSGGSPARWDMAGDWDSAGHTGAFDAWTADPLDAPNPLTGPVQRTDPVRRTGKHASVPQSPALGTPFPESTAPESPPLGTPVQENRAPWETGPQGAPRGNAPQGSVRASGAQLKYPWESGPQPVSPRDAQPGSRTGQQPVSGPGGQPESDPDAQPASRTGEHSGPQRAPWESGPQASVRATGARMSYPWESGPQPRFEPRGSQPVPPTGQTGEHPGPQRPPWDSGPQAPVPSSGTQPQPGHPWDRESQSAAAPTESQPGAQPVSQAGEQPPSRTGSQPVSRTEPKHASRDEPRPASPTGEYRVSRRPSWESGPQDLPPASGTQPQPGFPRESGPQPRFTPTVSRTGAQSVAPGDPRASSRMGTQPASPTGQEPASRTEGQSVSGTGAQLTPWTGAQPTFRPREESDSPTGTRPVEKALRESRTPAEVHEAQVHEARSDSSDTRSAGKAPWESGEWGNASDWDAFSAPGSRTGPHPVPQGGERPVSLTGKRPAEMAPWEPRSGPQPVSWPAEDPVPSTETRPVERAPWESGGWEGARGDRDALPATPEPEPEPETGSTGSGAWPVPERQAKPERHSHRASKHGRPSRWRGSGNRSGGDGES
jgi:hypothetical protein